MEQNIINLQKLLNELLSPNSSNKLVNAEVTTPPNLRKDMLDNIPSKFWKSPQKIYEPCCGKGGFLLDIIERFMVGLKGKIPDEELRLKTIVEECLYFSDINPTNIYICKILLNYQKYNLNFTTGDSLELDINEKWGINGFDAVISNPPYNAPNGIGSGTHIWHLFVKKSLGYWLKKNGLLVFIHPPGWRKPTTIKGRTKGLFDLMTKQNQMIFLSIHTKKEGYLNFKCGTAYDYYIIQNKEKFKNTIVVDTKKVSNFIDMGEWEWLPNYNLDTIQKLIAKETDEPCRNVKGNCKGVDVKTTEYCYGVVYTTPKKGTRWKYTNSKESGGFDTPKIIFGRGGCHSPVNDYKGEFGISKEAISIRINSKEEGDKLIKIITSEEFQKNIWNACLWSIYATEYILFESFSKKKLLEFEY